MADTNPDISKLSPDRLLDEFTKPRIAKCTGLATVIVVAVVAVFSIGDAIAMFAGPPVEEESAETQTEAPETVQAQTPGSTPSSDTTQTATNANGDSVPADAEGESAEAPEGNAYVEGLRETAEPEDIPGEPDLGISVEDTQF